MMFMGFTTSVFIFVFFPFCFLGYFISVFAEGKLAEPGSRRISKTFLLLISLFFYSFFNLYNLACIIMLISATYAFGRFTQRRKSKVPAAIGISVFVFILFFFKYARTLLGFASSVLGGDSVFFNIISPLGLSFVVFSSISYIVDVYRGDAPAAGFLDAALYIAFFPKIVSGPIVLWKDFSHELKSVKPDSELFFTGMNRLCIGFAKKVIIADTLSSYVNEAMKKDSPDIRLNTRDDFNISEEYVVDLQQNGVLVEENVPKYTLKHRPKNLTSKYRDKVSLDKDYHFFYYSRNSRAKSPKTLMFQGSYMNIRGYKFISNALSEYIAIHDYQNIFNFETYYKQFKPEYVVFEVAEYTFLDMYFSESKLDSFTLS